ncbi:MAG TPA: ATP-binding protein [Terriglobales bacterium]|nr:ATP-binding protein [Terriglobales bacterium]
MRGRIFFKLLLAFGIVLLSATLVLDLSIRHFWRESLTGEIERSLTVSSRQLAAVFDASSARQPQDAVALAGLTKQHSAIAGARVTVIDRSGKVLADSESDPVTMGNHAGRPEFVAALAGGTGRAKRRSETIGTEFLYVAVPISTGAVRLAYPLRQIESAEKELRKQLVLASSFAFLISILLAAIMARLMSQRLQILVAFADRIAAGDYSAKVADRSNDELTHVALQLQATADRLQQSFSEMEGVEKIRRDFIANVSHELRTPLTSIRGFAETLLDETSLTAEQRSFLEVITKHTARMSRLTDDLLALARVESGEENFVRENITAGDILADAQGALAALAAANSQTIVVEEIAPRAVRADPDAIHRVFTNLIENAVRNSKPDSFIRIGAREVEDGIQFYVRDAGTGIAPEHLSRVFERFYRVDPSRSADSGGTGLGLAIVKHIVLAHGGTIHVTSELGQGSTFFFVVPVAGQI